MTEIPKQIIESGARFVLVKPGDKAAFERNWQNHTYGADDKRLLHHISSGGNYGILAHGIGTIDVDNFDKWVDCGFKKLPDTFTDAREGKRFHVFFKCQEVPEEFKCKKIGMKFGDIRLPGHDSYVVGTNSVAYRTPEDPTQIPYEIFNPSPVKSISWEAIFEIIKRGSLESGNSVDSDSKENGSVKKQKFKITSDIPEGNREPTLHKLVWSLASRGLLISAIEAACLVENRNFSKPHTDDEVKRIVLKSYQSWIAKSEVNSEKKARMVKTALPDDPMVDFDEMRVSDQFCEHLAENYIYNKDTKLWHHWNGKVWEIDARDSIISEYVIFARCLYTKLPLIGDSEKRAKAFQRIQFFNSTNGRSHILQLAAHSLLMRSEDFDQNEDYLNLQNGTLEFVGDDIILREHRKDDLLSHICNVSYIPELGVSDTWVKHIKTVSSGDSDLGANYQFMMGYLLQGGNPLEKFTFMTGAGRNGKSVTLRTLSYILGDYAIDINPVTLMENGNKSNSPERKLMRGRRLITAQETRKNTDNVKDTCNIDTGFIKACSGRDAVSFRDNHGNVVDSFYVYGQIVLSTNNLPRVEDSTTAFWDRIVVLPFPHYFPDGERITNLDEVFRKESDKIFNWLIEGWRMYRKTKRFEPCAAVAEKIESYQMEADEYAPFVSAYITRDPDGTVSATDLYGLYQEWCRFMGRPIKSDVIFKKEFKIRYHSVKRNNGLVYVGIKLKLEKTA